VLGNVRRIVMFGHMVLLR